MIRLLFPPILIFITLSKINGNESNANLSLSIPDTLLMNINKDILIKEPDEIEIFVIEQMPEFRGGQKEMMKFIKNNNKYPVTEFANISVIVQFMVRKTGKIDSIRIVRGDNPILNKEAIRILKLMPDWSPGRQGVYFTLPFRFGEVKEVN